MHLPKFLKNKGSKDLVVEKIEYAIDQLFTQSFTEMKDSFSAADPLPLVAISPRSLRGEWCIQYAWVAMIKKRVDNSFHMQLEAIMNSMPLSAERMAVDMIGWLEHETDKIPAVTREHLFSLELLKVLGLNRIREFKPTWKMVSPIDRYQRDAPSNQDISGGVVGCAASESVSESVSLRLEHILHQLTDPSLSGSFYTLFQSVCPCCFTPRPRNTNTARLALVTFWPCPYMTTAKEAPPADPASKPGNNNIDNATNNGSSATNDGSSATNNGSSATNNGSSATNNGNSASNNGNSDNATKNKNNASFGVLAAPINNNVQPRLKALTVRIPCDFPPADAIFYQEDSISESHMQKVVQRFLEHLGQQLRRRRFRPNRLEHRGVVTAADLEMGLPEALIRFEPCQQMAREALKTLGYEISFFVTYRLFELRPLSVPSAAHTKQ